MLPEHDVLVVDEGARARRPGHLDDHRRGDARDGARRRPSGPARLADGDRRGRGRGRSSSRAVLDELARGPAHRHPRLPGAGPRPGCATPPARSRASSSPRRATSPTARRKVARAAVDEVHENASRILEERELDVVWLSRDPRRGPVLRVAPMSVAMVVRDNVFDDRTVVLTSRDARARRLVRRRGRHHRAARRGGAGVARASTSAARSTTRSRRIAYVAQHLPAPGRDGLAAETLDEIEALVRAAGGRTLGLFSSMRAAQEATEAMRERLRSRGRHRLSSARARTRSPPSCASSPATRGPACSAR